MALRLFLLLLLLPFSSVAAAQNDLPPSDAELRSAYCIPVLKWQIKMISHDLASLDEASSRQDQSFQQNPPPSPDVQKQLAELQRQSLVGREKVREGLARRQSTLDRLQSHLLLRFMNLDPFALALATQRGEADLQELRDMSRRCGNQCGISDQIGGPGPDDKAKACVASCSDKDLLARLKACAEPSWLPF